MTAETENVSIPGGGIERLRFCILATIVVTSVATRVCPTGRIVITKEKKIARNGPRSEKKKKKNLNRIDLVASFQTRFKIKINSLDKRFSKARI